MTLSPQQVRKHVMDYLEATECSILEVSPLHVTVKLSPRADRMLTDRPYYWGFVERTGVDPETLSFTFVFDPEKYDSLAAQAAPPPRAQRARQAALRPGFCRAQEATLARQRWKPARTARRPVSGSRHPQGRLPLKQIRRTAFSPATSALCRYCRGSDRA